MLHLKLHDLLIDTNNDDLISYSKFTFNGGENHIKIDFINKVKGKDVLIESRLDSAHDIMNLLLATDSLKRLGTKTISLFTPYFPYSRQDRICNEGEALSVKVIANLINSQTYEKVFTLHDHSNVTPALINNHTPINLFQLLEYGLDISYLKEVPFIISPDSGALKTTLKIAQRYNKTYEQVIKCTKVRNLTTGEITNTQISHNDLQGKDCLIIDDICDGGRTFIEIAKELKKRNGGEITLYISHGIFSNGLNVFNGIIDKIITTTSIMQEHLNIPILTMQDKIYQTKGICFAIPFRKEYLND